MQIPEPGKTPNGNSLLLAANWQVEGAGGERPPGTGLGGARGGVQRYTVEDYWGHTTELGERLSQKPHSGLDLEARLACEYSRKREEREKIKG